MSCLGCLENEIFYKFASCGCNALCKQCLSRFISNDVERVMSLRTGKCAYCRKEFPAAFSAVGKVMPMFFRELCLNDFGLSSVEENDKKRVDAIICVNEIKFAYEVLFELRTTYERYTVGEDKHFFIANITFPVVNSINYYGGLKPFVRGLEKHYLLGHFDKLFTSMDTESKRIISETFDIIRLNTDTIETILSWKKRIMEPERPATHSYNLRPRKRTIQEVER